MALVSKTFSQIITFSRASGATWFNSVGVLQGVDFSVTSNTIGTGSKTFTLDATAGVDRYWAPGDTVLISDQANSANNMVGTVTSYNASTQVLVCNITSTGGSGTITSWRIGSTMPRFDYDPATLAARGFLIEEARTNSLTYSEAFDTTPNWGVVRSTITANAVVAPDGNTTADKLVEDSTAANSHYVAQNVVHTGAQTLSLFAKKAEIEGLILWGIGATSYAAGFNLTTGTSYTEAISGVIPPDISTNIVNVGNGWFRCSISFNASSGTSIRLLLDKNLNGTGISNGDGTSGIYIWGAQLE